MPCQQLLGLHLTPPRWHTKQKHREDAASAQLPTEQDLERMHAIAVALQSAWGNAKVQ